MVTIKRPKLADVRCSLLRSNPEAKTIDARWEREPRLVRCPTGIMAWFGTVWVEAQGFRGRRMTVSRDSEGLMIR